MQSPVMPGSITVSITQPAPTPADSYLRGLDAEGHVHRQAVALGPEAHRKVHRQRAEARSEVARMEKDPLATAHHAKKQLVPD